MARKKVINNALTFRINDISIFNKFEEAMQTGIYSSKNELANKCIELAIEEILNIAKGKHEKLYKDHESKCDKLAHEVYLRAKQQDKKQSELLLEVLANQQILLSVFNMLLLSNKDKADMVQRGLLTDKPKYLLDFYKDLEE